MGFRQIVATRRTIPCARERPRGSPLLEIARCLVFFGVIACHSDAEPGPVVTIAAYFPALCAPQTPNRPARFRLTALGDFDSSATTSESLDESGRGELVIPFDTRAAIIEATDGFSQWLGVGQRRLDDAILQVGLLPDSAACELFRPRSTPEAPLSDFSFARAGETFAWSPTSGQILLTGGDSNQSSAVTAALMVDAASGLVRWVADDRGPRTRRAQATATLFGERLLISGGVDPLEDSRPVDTAEVFDPRSAEFDVEPIVLQTARAEHGAVVLMNGETLLVGGRNEGGRVLRTLEAISPETRRFRISGLTSLTEARKNPSVLRLTDGRVLVAGGEDASGQPIGSLEWLSPDGGRVVRVVSRPDFRPSRGRVFVAMPGGGALAVGGCELDPTMSSGECIATDSAYWIKSDGAIDVLPRLDAGAENPTLVEASDGRPFLVADSSCPRSKNCEHERTLRRFDPWSGRFVFPDSSPHRLPMAGERALALDPGAFAWLSHDGSGLPTIFAYRHGSRGPFAQDVSPLVEVDTEHLVPSELPRDTGSSSIFYDLANRTLSLRAPSQSVTVADATYRSLRLEVAVKQGAPPRVTLGPLTVGSDACPWPRAPKEDRYVARVLRSVSSLEIEIEGATSTCEDSDEWVPVVVEAPEGGVVIESLAVGRKP